MVHDGEQGRSGTSIAPLLKRMVNQDRIDEEEINAARQLKEQAAISENQLIALIGLLHISGHALSASEQQLLEEVASHVHTDRASHQSGQQTVVSRLLRKEGIEASDVVQEISSIFSGRVEPRYCSLLLALLASTGLDREPAILAMTAAAMRQAATIVDHAALQHAVRSRCMSYAQYNGGLCDIVGTGGDGHSVYNVSTTASIVASPLLMMSKHGNRASSSTSGSADLLQAIEPEAPRIDAVDAKTLPKIYAASNYAFLFAPVFHPGMRHVAALRKDIGIRTIFNVLGPLANPVNAELEARVVGVAEKSMGPVFAEALRLSGADKALVVCGAEGLDELSCAGPTHCWRTIRRKDGEFSTETFQLHPSDFGLQCHPLAQVAGGRLPQENAKILMELLHGKLAEHDPILDFVLMNTAVLLAISGICEDEVDSSSSTSRSVCGAEVIPDRGPGGERWREGVRRARWAIESGEALRSLNAYIAAIRNV